MMTKGQLITIIEDILNNELEKEVQIVQQDMSLAKLGIDSITFMMLIVYMENRLEMEIDLKDVLDEDYSELKIDALIEAVLRKYGC